MRTLRPWIRGALIVFAAAAATAACGLWRPEAAAELPTICLFRRLTGIDCPGCGMGRALLYAAAGDTAASFSCHPLGLPFLLWMMLWALIPERLLERWRRAGSAGPGTAAAAASLLLLSIWVLRLAAAGAVPATA